MVKSIRKISVALALTLGMAAALPAAAEAGHRHSRSCGHRSGYYGSGYGSGYYGSGYYDNYSYGYPSYRSYEYRYRPRPYYYSYYDPYPRYYYAPRRSYGYVHYHSGRRCSRPHVSISFGF